MPVCLVTGRGESGRLFMQGTNYDKADDDVARAMKSHPERWAKKTQPKWTAKTSQPTKRRAPPASRKMKKD